MILRKLYIQYKSFLDMFSIFWDYVFNTIILFISVLYSDNNPWRRCIWNNMLFNFMVKNVEIILSFILEQAYLPVTSLPPCYYIVILVNDDSCSLLFRKAVSIFTVWFIICFRCIWIRKLKSSVRLAECRIFFYRHFLSVDLFTVRHSK